MSISGCSAPRPAAGPAGRRGRDGRDACRPPSQGRRPAGEDEVDEIEDVEHVGVAVVVHVARHEDLEAADLPVLFSVNQMFPSGPLVIPYG